MTQDQKYDTIIKALGNLESDNKDIRKTLGNLESDVQTLKQIFVKEQEINHSRYQELRSDIGDLKSEIQNVYKSLSQDIQVFAEDLAILTRRHDRLEQRMV